MAQTTKRDMSKKWRDKAEAFWKLYQMYDEGGSSDNGHSQDEYKKDHFNKMWKLADEAANDFTKI